MSLTTVPVDRNAEATAGGRAEPDRTARRKLARMAVYARVGRIGRTPSRAYACAYLAWRLGDIPLEPVAADVDLPDTLAAGWRGTVELWLAEAMADVD